MASNQGEEHSEGSRAAVVLAPLSEQSSAHILRSLKPADAQSGRSNFMCFNKDFFALLTCSLLACLIEMVGFSIHSTRRPAPDAAG